MSTGRHAKKRAAQTEERLVQEQEDRLAKEEARKGVMEKDIESQRIATMRARFGGAAPEASGNNTSTQTTAPKSSAEGQKYSTPKPLTKRNTNSPMKQTILGMMLDDGDQGV
jgi:hypothetical protein